MFSWLTRRVRREASVLAFGKVPSQAEYVRSGSNDGAGVELQDWLTKAVAWGANHRAEAWKAALHDAPALRFVLRTRDPETVIAGVVQPSHDAVGRHFPFAIAALLPVKGKGEISHLTAAVFDPFFHQAAALLPRATSIDSSKDLDALLAGLHPPSLSDVTDVQQRYDQWIGEQRAGDVLDGVFASLAANAESTLHTILEATSPFRGQEAPPTALSIRLPIDPGLPLLSCFWLQVVRAASGWKETVPGFFCTAGEMLVQLGGLTSPSVLADAWAPDDHSQHVCRATGDTSSFVISLPEGVHACLQSSESTVEDLLRLLP